MNIYESITAILNEKAVIKKDSENTSQHYKFRGIDALMNVFNPLLAKHKVFVVPTVLDMTREERMNMKGNTLLYTILTVQYTFYAEDGSSITSVVTGEGMDTGDKSVNKAMSAAYKYALFQVFCIPTEDMIDSEQDSPEVAPKAAPICERCGKPIKPVQKKDGSIRTVDDILSYSRDNFNADYCGACCAALTKARNDEQGS